MRTRVGIYEPAIATETTAVSVGEGIRLPDHPVRSSLAYQLYARLWRPTLGWIACPVAVTYATVIAPATGHPLSDGYLVQVLMFAGAVFGLQTFERTKGVA